MVEKKGQNRKQKESKIREDEARRRREPQAPHARLINQRNVFLFFILFSFILRLAVCIGFFLGSSDELYLRPLITVTFSQWYRIKKRRTW